MSRLLVCSLPDLPSVNMKEALLGFHGWDDMGERGGLSFLSYGDTVMVTIPDFHLYHESIDREVEDLGFKVDEVIFMSKHSAKSGTPALTVHPIGNYHGNEFGGREGALVKANPPLMSDALRRIVQRNDMPENQLCFEVTHHGPWLERPTFFIEVGSIQEHWENKHAAGILAHVIEDLDPHPEYPVAVGVGGGHYAPRFTEIALSYNVNIGHMLPNYQMEGRDDEDIARMLRLACEASGTRLVYLHRKSMKGAEARRLSSLIESAGLEPIDSGCLEKISES